jgi:hypothetical protein
MQPGEVYYEQETDPGWGDVVELSRLSMERSLYLTFAVNPGLEGLAERVREEREEALAEEYRRYSPVDSLFRDQEG